MKSPVRLTLALALAALATLPAAALAQSVELRYRVEPGLQRTYDRLVRTEMSVRSGDQSRKTVLEVPVVREELVLETKASPTSLRVISLDQPAGERLVTLEENGQDRLAAIPEAERTRPLPPVLSSQWRDLAGRPVDPIAPAPDPTRAMEVIQAQMRFLPEQPLKPGDTWTRDVDAGVAKARLTGRYVENRTEGTTRCAVLDVTAAVTFTGDFAARLKVEQMTSQTVWALDGTGWVALAGSMILTEKTEKAEQHIARTFTEKLKASAQLDAAKLTKAKADLAGIEKAMEMARAGNLDGAVAGLEAYLKENPQASWATAVQNLAAGLGQQRLLTQAVPAPRLRLMLRDLQTARDQAGSQGNAAQVDQLDQTIRQVATTNQATILGDSKDPDPIVRDLATFGLTFITSDDAAARLMELAKDGSPQVRGTAVLGLAIRGKAVPAALLTDLLKDSDARIRGAAALLASRSVKPEDPQVAAVLPLLYAALGVDNLWSRMNAVAAVATLAPKGSAAAARALIGGHKAEKEPRLQPAYLAALRTVTGVEGDTLQPFEEWAAKQK